MILKKQLTEDLIKKFYRFEIVGKTKKDGMRKFLELDLLISDSVQYVLKEHWITDERTKIIDVYDYDDKVENSTLEKVAEIVNKYIAMKSYIVVGYMRDTVVQRIVKAIIIGTVKYFYDIE